MSQSLAKILVHLIYSTKHRDPILTPEVLPKLWEYQAGIFQDLESHAIECVFRRLRPPIPIEGGHSFRGKAAIFRSAATRVVQLSMSSYRIALRESSFVPFSFAWTLP